MCDVKFLHLSVSALVCQQHRRVLYVCPRPVFPFTLDDVCGAHCFTRLLLVDFVYPCI